MAVANVMEEVTSSREKKYFSLGMFLGLSKAFDTVDPAILIKETFIIWYTWSHTQHFLR